MPETTVGLTVSEALRQATARLTQAGCDTPRLDSELLLGAALGVGRERLVMDADNEVDRDALAGFAKLLAQRVRREPVAYILGRREFRRITLTVDPRVLIPRPETELLVEVGFSLPSGARVVDVGTGSGAIALALKDERPDLDVWATDVSADALAVARANGEALGLQVQWREADLMDGLDGFDALLANLPYVAEDEALAPEIERYEPPEALLAGPDGLAVIRRLTAQIGGVRLVALEVGAGQADAVSRLMRGAGLGSVETLRDLAGHERVVVGRTA